MHVHLPHHMTQYNREKITKRAGQVALRGVLLVQGFIDEATNRGVPITMATRKGM